MAYSEGYSVISATAGSTFAASDLYKFVIYNSSGDVEVANGSGNILPAGVLYGRTSTTSASGSQAVPVAVSGVVKVNMAASTLSAGDWVASSTAGLGIAPSTDGYVAGQIVSGSSGGAGRIVSVLLLSGPLDSP